MIPQMVQRGFDRDFAVNVSITAALVALLVPPSHNLILYSAAAGSSAGASGAAAPWASHQRRMSVESAITAPSAVTSAGTVRPAPARRSARYA